MSIHLHRDLEDLHRRVLALASSVEEAVESSIRALFDLTSKEAILDSVHRYAAAHPGDAWIRGSGWQLPVFPAANPHKEWLDAVVPGRPVFLRAADGHSAWVNSRALALAGVTRETPDPPNGRIERDPRTRRPD